MTKNDISSRSQGPKLEFRRVNGSTARNFWNFFLLGSEWRKNSSTAERSLHPLRRSSPSIPLHHTSNPRRRCINNHAGHTKVDTQKGLGRPRRVTSIHSTPSRMTRAQARATGGIKTPSPLKKGGCISTPRSTKKTAPILLLRRRRLAQLRQRRRRRLTIHLPNRAQVDAQEITGKGRVAE